MITNQQNAIRSRPRDIKVPMSKAQIDREFNLTLLIAIAHLGLGILFYRIGSFGVIHPYAALIVGLYWAIKKEIRLERISFVGAYIIGSEVLWRMADVPVFWEFGKYSVSLIMVVALVRRGLVKFPGLAAMFLLFQIPGCILTILNHPPAQTQVLLSFNMSGPLLLTISCWFFSHVKLNRAHVKKILLIMIIPILSVGFTTLFFTLSTSDISFSLDSNEATSGGFGPNQVSSMLGLGAFAAVASLLLFNETTWKRIIIAAVAIFMSAQSAMTFSRGGMYNAVGALVVLFFFQIKDLRTFFRKLLPVAALVLFFFLVIFPILNNFTGGVLGERFESTESTNRIEIVQSDFQILMESPILGVGVGAARMYRAKFLDFSSASHTEFSRLISEHGILGIISIICLFSMTFLNIKRQIPGFGRAFTAGLVVWCFLFMLNAGMRLAAPGFLFGAIFATLISVQSRKRKVVRRPAIRNRELSMSHGV